MCAVLYDDGDREDIDLSQEQYKFLPAKKTKKAASAKVKPAPAAPVPDGLEDSDVEMSSAADDDSGSDDDFDAGMSSGDDDDGSDLAELEEEVESEQQDDDSGADDSPQCPKDKQAQKRSLPESKCSLGAKAAKKAKDATEACTESQSGNKDPSNGQSKAVKGSKGTVHASQPGKLRECLTESSPGPGGMSTSATGVFTILMRSRISVCLLGRRWY
jgi:hypothetical protein